MPIVKCFECQKPVSDTASNCPHCGAKFAIRNKNPFALPLKVLWYSACALVLVVVFKSCYSVGTAIHTYTP